MSAIPSLISYRLPTASNLPENTARWSVDPKRAVLLVHDMQKYFMSFFSRELRGELVSNISSLQRACRSAGIPSAYSAQPGGMSEEERGLLRDFWGPGMRAAPQDRLIVDELSPERDDWNVTKWRYSAFVRSDLMERMKAVGRDQIILSGVYAHVGLMATAIDAFSNDIQPFFVADATADFSQDFHEQALRYVAQRCAYVTTAGDVLR